MSAPHGAIRQAHHDGDEEASIPEGERRGARSPHVEMRGDEDSGQGDLEGGAEVPRTDWGVGTGCP